MLVRNIHALTASILILAWKEISSGPASTNSLCQTLGCENDSGCRLRTENNRTTAECVCRGDWLGRRCNNVLSINVVLVTMTTATLRVVLTNLTMTGDGNNVTGVDSQTGPLYNSTDLKYKDVLDNTTQRTPSSVNNTLTYSLHYWNTDRMTTCHIVAIATERNTTIRGLTGNANYVFCAKNYHSGLCSPFLVNDSVLPENCVAITTAKYNTDITSTYFRILTLSIVVLIALLVLIIIIVISLRKKYFYQLMCAGDIYNKRKGQRQRKTNQGNSDLKQEQLLLSMVTASPIEETPTEAIEMDVSADKRKYFAAPSRQLVRITPPNTPGKPKHQLTQHAKRGYVSFATRNEQTIPLTTVVEYKAEEDE